LDACLGHDVPKPPPHVACGQRCAIAGEVEQVLRLLGRHPQQPLAQQFPPRSSGSRPCASTWPAEHDSIGHDLERPPDKILAFVSCMPLLLAMTPFSVRLRLPDAPGCHRVRTGEVPAVRDETCAFRRGGGPRFAADRAHGPRRPRTRRRARVGGPDAGDQPSIGSQQHDLAAGYHLMLAAKNATGRGPGTTAARGTRLSS